MTYDPTIPILTNNISVDATQMQINFDQANTLFDNDHWTFNDANSANRGYHRQVYFPQASASDPAIGAFAGVFFNKNDTRDTSTKPQLFFKNGSTYQITNRFFDASTNGYYMLPTGVLLMWGYRTGVATGTQTVTFPTIANYIYSGGQTQGFPNALFNVQLTIENDSAQDGGSVYKSGTVDKKKFEFRVTTGGGNVYWFAIGN